MKNSLKKEPDFKSIIAVSEEEFEMGKLLFHEYSESLDFDLCFQNFEKELKEINVQYNSPDGGLILIVQDSKFIGCAGIRKFEGDIGELKRMYIKSEYRGFGLGKKLLWESIKLAAKLGYKKIRLDTLTSMKAAVHLYKKNGFKETEAYRFNPSKDVLYFEKVID